MLTCVLKPNAQYDEHCEVILSVMLPLICKVFKKLFTDHLPGGKYCNPSEALLAQTKRVPYTNKVAESVFAYLDGLLNTKPHISPISAEAYLMFIYNKTAIWLEGQDDKIIREAMAVCRDIELEYKRWCAELHI